MPTVSVDNSPVSVALNDDETVTVPSGETWVVTIVAYDVAYVNGSYATSPAGTDAVLSGGDTVEMNGGSGLITGWKL